MVPSIYRRLMRIDRWFERTVSGRILGGFVFALLRAIGQLDLFISLLYVVFLGTVGGLMLIESVNALRLTKGGVVRVKIEDDKPAFDYTEGNRPKRTAGDDDDFVRYAHATSQKG